MQLRLPRTGRPVVTVFGGVLLGALLVGAGPPVQAAWDRPACAETVMKAVATEQTVQGTYGCFDDTMKAGLQTIGIDSDGAFATRVGQKA